MIPGKDHLSGKLQNPHSSSPAFCDTWTCQQMSGVLTKVTVERRILAKQFHISLVVVSSNAGSKIVAEPDSGVLHLESHSLSELH